MLDASVVVDLLLWPAGAGRVIERLSVDRSLHAPAVLDLEVAQTIRRLCARREVSERRGREAVGDLEDVALRRYPHAPLLYRIWQLRHTLSAYDAAYIALAEVLQAPLLTRDRRLAASRGHAATIEVL